MKYWILRKLYTFLFWFGDKGGSARSAKVPTPIELGGITIEQAKAVTKRVRRAA